MESKKSGGFFQNLFGSLFGSNDAEAEKKRQLKLIAKKYAKSKFNKFYKVQGNEALPPLARTFFEIYKAIYPAQTMFQGIQNPNTLKRLSIDFFLPAEIRDLEDSITEEKLLALAQKLPAAKIREEALNRLSNFSDYFSLEKVNAINTLYMQILAFKDLCTFDYFFTLKKFCKSMKEASFNALPPFEKINAEYIIDDLKDFVSVAWALPTTSDYSNMIKMLKLFKGGVEPITLQNWKKIVSRISTLKSSGAFEMMIKLISSNPGEVVTINSQSTNIVEPYLDNLKTSTESVVEKLITQERNSKTNDLSEQLFNGIQLSLLKNYTEEKNQVFSRKGVKTFIHSQALIYLKTFLIEIFKKDIREYYDIVVVRGHWESQAISSPFSESYNELLTISEKITGFDASLADDASIGVKIKTLLPKTDRDNGAKNIINRLIQDANDSAYEFVTSSTKNVITIGKSIKALVEDIQKQKPSVITNWKELIHFSEKPLKEFSVDIYKKIYLFTMLIKTSLANGEEE
ncbi:MAG: hypothetical protein HDR51_07775 [Treponema sp.]|nr:hypothetical protein [Treponema sp.]